MRFSEIKPLKFKISSGLKSIIGRDLIVSDFVAVFELVKNSFDAHSKNVFLFFDAGNIWVIDDGKGMSYQDVVNKWLFVAYSAKRDGTEDNDYRAHGGGNPTFAGNKGVGRFSCDRLGAKLQLQSRKEGENGVEVLDVDWGEFEKNGLDEFVNIPVLHSKSNTFSLPDTSNGHPFYDQVNDLQHGTVLRISGVRDAWSREKLRDLKGHLTKLINPFDGGQDGFKVFLAAPHEIEEDVALKEGVRNASEDKREVLARQIINGKIENFIFSELSTKTTRIEVGFTNSGSRLRTTLVDRGKIIYSVEEDNVYPLLAEADFSCKLFYLNQSAKATFARRMGVPSVSFGSVFVFRNGFRVFPIGDEGDDTFGIDARKQQGYARYLGTREIIGRIDVHGGEHLFREPSSRDQGLVDTPAYRELTSCFWEKCLKGLERYVVDVTWKDKLDKFREDASGLYAAPARARLIELVSDLANAQGIEIIEYSEDLVDILSDKVEQFESSLKDLKIFAEATGNNDLVKRISGAEKRYRELQETEKRAINLAEQERAARLEAESRARTAELARQKAEVARQSVEVALHEEKKRNLFLASVSTLDVETVTNLHHQVIICAADIHELIESQIDKLKRGRDVDRESLFSFLEQMRLRNQQVLAIARIATKANFRMESDEIEDDLPAYVYQYLNNIASVYQRVKINIGSPGKEFIRHFKPIELSIVLDNLLSNAKKANASMVDVSFGFPSLSVMKISFSDYGDGLDSSVMDPNSIFEKGVSTTDGSGLGLYHVNQIIQAMGGSISYSKPSHNGAEFVITLPK